MNEMLKRGFFLGLGVAALGKEKIQSYIDDLVHKGKISPREAEQWKEDLIKKGKDVEADFSKENKSRIQESLQDMGMATQHDIQRLEQKLNALEEKLSSSSSHQDDESI